MEKVYIVFGATGEYSDHQEWPVRAYLDEKKAEKMVELCSEEFRRIKTTYPDRWRRDDKKDPHKYDPGFQQDYTGTNYYIVEVELEA